jgi:AraC family transcriptional regulator
MKFTNDLVAVLQPTLEHSEARVKRTFFTTPSLTVIRQSSSGPPTEAPIIHVPCEDAFSIITQLDDFKSHKLWRGKQVIHVGGHAKASTAITHLGEEWRCQHLSAFDNLRFHITRSALDVFTFEAGQKRIACFDFVPDRLDPVIFHLAQALLPVLDLSHHFFQLYSDHIALALFAHVATQYGHMPQKRVIQYGKLAKWQENRAKEYMRSNLAQSLSLEQIAQECGLSRAHFARNFKNTTGVPVHEWLQRLRIEQAKLLLVKRDQTLAQIALSCGFADQSHFTRVFRNVVGMAPGMWRRMSELDNLGLA